MTRSQKFFLACLCVSFSAFSGTIEVAQWIPWNFVTKEISNIPIDVHYQENARTLEIGELRPVIQSLAVSMNGELEELSFSKEGITSKEKLSGRIEIGKVIIDQVITREFNGSQIQVEIKASCSPFSIVLNNFSTHASATFYQSGRVWMPELNQLNIFLTNQNWSMSPIVCTGIGGIAEEISSELTASLNNPSSFQGLLQSLLGSELKRIFLSTWTGITNSTGPELIIDSMGKPSDLGITIFAYMPIKKSLNIPLIVFDESELSDQTPQILLGQDGFSALVEDQFMQKAPQAYNLQEVSGFHSLMQSRFKQYFVWPDLRRFTSDTPFLVYTDTDHSTLKLTNNGQTEWSAVLNSMGTIQTEIGSSKIDYMIFNLVVKTNMKISVEDSILTITNASSSLDLAWNYGLLYQLLFNPNRRISVSLLKSAMTPAFSNQKIQTQLPVLNWAGEELKLQNWKLNNGLITMDWL